MQQAIFAGGHSNHSREVFISLLSLHGIPVLCHVQSKPYSRQELRFQTLGGHPKPAIEGHFKTGQR
jgi:hypothetical protein